MQGKARFRRQEERVRSKGRKALPRPKHLTFSESVEKLSG